MRVLQRLGKLVSGDSEGNVTALQEELINQKMLIEEKTRELEERNLLLVKARNAIETLQADLELAQGQSQEYSAMGFGDMSGFGDSERAVAKVSIGQLMFCGLAWCLGACTCPWRCFQERSCVFDFFCS